MTHRSWFALSLTAAVLAGAAPAAAQGLSFLESFEDGVGGVAGLDRPSAVAVSDDGNSVYTASLDDDSIAVFSRDTGDGTLTFVEVLTDGVGGVDGLARATDVTVSPDGQHVYATGFTDAAVAVFSRNPTTSALTFVEVQRNLAGNVAGGLAGAEAVEVSADGAHVYVAGALEDTVAIFSRDSTTGMLTFVDFLQRGVGGVMGIAGARSIAISPDGTDLYVAGPNDNALAVFTRDPATGLLSFVEFHQDGVGGVDGLDAVNHVAVSPDGEHVYAASPLDSAISIFARTGSLSFVGIAQNGFLGISGLLNTRGVDVSSDGQKVLAVGFLDDALVSFQRDANTGLLTFVDNAFDGVEGVDGLDGATAVAISADSANAYAVGELGSAIAVFAVDGAGPPPPPPVGDDLDGQTITYQWRFGGLDGAIQEGPLPAVVGDGTEFPSIGVSGQNSNLSLDVSATNFRLDWTGSFFFSGGFGFNGHIYSDGSGFVPAFDTVTIHPETNLPGFDASRLSFDDDNIQVDFAGLGGGVGTVVSLDVALVPEPSGAAAAFGLCFALLALGRHGRVA